MNYKHFSRDVTYLINNQNVSSPDIFQAQVCEDVNTFSELLSLDIMEN